MTTNGDGPLAGLRVLELGTMIAGPFVGRLLGDLGADVIKAEPPDSGDVLRTFGRHLKDGKPLFWPLMSRNKRLITLNLRDPDGQRLCERIAATCDVLVENFRPGTMERWNLGPARLAEVNPRLVYARLSGYGQTGPLATRVGFASTGEAMAGLRYVNGWPGEAPPRMGISLGDSMAGVFTVIGILAALVERGAVGSGRGQVIDASILESCVALTEAIVAEYAAFGVVREPSGGAIRHATPSNIFKSRDGTWVVVAANNDNLWRRLAPAIGHPEWLDDPRFATMHGRSEHVEEIEATIAAWCAQRDATTIDAELDAAGVVCGPIASAKDVFENPHLREREMVTAMNDAQLGELWGPGVHPKFSRTPGRIRFLDAWEPGRFNREVYGELGIDGAELDDYRARGIV